MNKNTKIVTATVGLAVALTLTLAGCVGAPTTHNANTPKPSVSPTATATPTEKPSVNIAELKAGDAVDPSTADTVNKSNGDKKAYKLNDGSYVVVDNTQPLPAAVKAAVTATVAPVAAPISGGVTSSDTEVITEQQIVAAVNAQAKATGKPIIAVFGAHVSSGYYYGTLSSLSDTGNTGITASTNKATVVAAATAWAAKNGAEVLILN